MMIGAHPDDEDTFLIAWLSRGRHVQTAYLSLTRGDGGQNLIGNELGEALGVIRTEELYAARRVDGAQQFFTRAFDFGFSKDTVDTFRHWPRDEVLGDVVSAVRAFRPHVIVAVFSGTPRDGHGHHQVSGILAREAYELAPDTGRFPVERDVERRRR
jgi:LmbE family N-acetylglucosaminyl deacetylase